jgi:hypothetical protein
MPRFAETVEPLFPIAGLTLVGLVLYQIYNIQESFANIEGMTANPVPSKGMILGSTDANGQLNTVLQDASGQTVPVVSSDFAGIRTRPGSLSVGPGTDGFSQASDSIPPTWTTQFGSTIPVSTQPGVDDLIHYNPDNFDMTYHSVDPAQYFGMKDLINKDGTLNFDKLYDLYAPVQIGPRPYQVSYKDSVLFTQYG